MFLRLLLVCHYVFVCYTFNPSYKAIFSRDGSATHASITRCSLATVTAEYFQTRFSITVTKPNIINGTCPPSFFLQIQKAFSLTSYFGGSTYSQWENMIDEIVDHNELVDVLEAFDESRHFDSESFPEGSNIIKIRLQAAITAVNANDFEASNDHFGRLSHTLQDFYSHSNWIELNNGNPHPDLGINKLTPAQFAGPNARTCSNCTTGPDAVCRGNCDVSKALTSGYFVFRKDIFTKKPKGKCSHGGSDDATRDNDAIGGINKDSIASIHGYLHFSAAQTAYLATCKTLRDFRGQVGDVAFGKFLNVLSRKSTTSRSFGLVDTFSQKLGKMSPYVYTNILSKLRKSDTFTTIRQIVAVPAVDSICKAHILSLAKRKHVTIDIFRSDKYSQLPFDFGEDLAILTGGLYAFYDDDEQIDMDMNPNNRPELIDIFSTKSSSDTLTINTDQACSKLFLEFFSDDEIPRVQIQLRKGNQTISSPSIITDTTYYRSYSVSNLSPGPWQLFITRSKAFIFDLHASCSSDLRCFSRLFVDNGNTIHSGLAELQGNLIEKQNVLLMSTCDSPAIPIRTVQVTMIDSINGASVASTIRSVFDEQSNRWVTNLTNIPSKLFRLKFSINNGSIVRLSRSSYQPSLVDVEIIQVQTTVKNKTMIAYKLLNYHSQLIKLKLSAKNIGQFSLTRNYEVEARDSEYDEIEYDSKDRQSDLTSDSFSLTVVSEVGDWNYDVVSF